MLDYAIPQNTGFPVAGSGFEACQCPAGYAGSSCEECQSGYYRDVMDKTECPMGACKPCPCPRFGQ